jgi:hypothetical protein
MDCRLMIAVAKDGDSSFRIQIQAIIWRSVPAMAQK